MKSIIFLSAALTPAALALPTFDSGVSSLIGRDDAVNALADNLMFGISLPEFIKHRNALDPAQFDWTSDGCTKSPDNPFGFPFVPACNRHDFGYQNFRAEKRFTKANKSRIDGNFQKDLIFQCDSSAVKAKTPCKALAKVYHAAVVKFGGKDATKRSADEEAEFAELMTIYRRSVEEAQANGELPILEDDVAQQ